MHAADAVIAVSRYTSNLVFNQYRIDLNKLHIVHKAHEHDFDVLTKKKKFKGPVILFLGRITLQKGPDYFLEVGNRIVKKHSDAKFIMAGSGDMENQIIHRSAYYKLKNNFLFTGFLKRQDVFEIFSFTDIYVLTSVSEPFGIAPLEAMSFGIPAIISSRSGVAEVVDNAIKIDFWDIDRLTSSIEYLINNPKKRKEIGEKSKKEVETIRWQTASEKIKKIYRGLL
jgi:glycosyltransferase involved in cell wall biosynthesis